MKTYAWTTILCVLFCPSYEVLLEPSIVEAQIGQLPYHVAFKKPDVDQSYEISKRFYTFCAGAIIGENKVLTIADCFVQSSNDSNSCTRSCRGCYAVAGTVRSVGYYKTDENGYEQWRKILKIKLPSTYKCYNTDVATVILKKPFQFNEFVKPIRYGPHPFDFKDYCDVSGYSSSSFNKHSDSLIIKRLLLMPQKSCDNIFKTNMSDFICVNNNDSVKTDVIRDMTNIGSPLVCTDTKNVIEEDEDQEIVLVGLMTKDATNNSVNFLFTRLPSNKSLERRDLEPETKPPYVESTTINTTTTTVTEHYCTGNRYKKLMSKSAENPILQLIVDDKIEKGATYLTNLIGYSGAQAKKEAKKIKRGNLTAKRNKTRAGKITGERKVTGKNNIIGEENESKEGYITNKGNADEEDNLKGESKIIGEGNVSSEGDLTEESNMAVEGDLTVEKIITGKSFVTKEDDLTGESNASEESDLSGEIKGTGGSVLTEKGKITGEDDQIREVKIIGEGKVPGEDGQIREGKIIGEGKVTGEEDQIREGKIIGEGKVTGEDDQIREGKIIGEGKVTGEGDQTKEGNINEDTIIVTSNSTEESIFTEDSDQTEESIIIGEGNVTGEGNKTNKGNLTGEEKSIREGNIIIDEGNATGDTIIVASKITEEGNVTRDEIELARNITEEDNITRENELAGRDNITGGGNITTEGNVTEEDNITTEGNVTGEDKIITVGNVNGEDNITTEYNVTGEDKISTEVNVTGKDNITTVGDVTGKGNITTESNVTIKGNITKSPSNDTTGENTAVHDDDDDVSESEITEYDDGIAREVKKDGADYSDVVNPPVKMSLNETRRSKAERFSISIYTFYVSVIVLNIFH